MRAVLRGSKAIRRGMRAFSNANGKECCCDSLRGACCLPNGNCMPNVTHMQCLQQNGSWVGPNTSCTPHPCVAPGLGACCRICFDSCFVTQESLCTASDRIWIPGVNCDHCPPPPSGCPDSGTHCPSSLVININEYVQETTDGSLGHCVLTYHPVTLVVHRPGTNAVWYTTAESGTGTYEILCDAHDEPVTGSVSYSVSSQNCPLRCQAPPFPAPSGTCPEFRWNFCLRRSAHWFVSLSVFQFYKMSPVATTDSCPMGSYQYCVSLDSPGICTTTPSNVVGGITASVG